jgi:hypothetical protein
MAYGRPRGLHPPVPLLDLMHPRHSGTSITDFAAALHSVQRQKFHSSACIFAPRLPLQTLLQNHLEASPANLLRHVYSGAG